MKAASAAKLEAIRRGLTSAAEAHWKKLLATTGGPHGAVVRAAHLGEAPPTAQKSYALARVDPARQCGEAGARLIVHAEAGVAWALRLDADLLAVMSRVRELQANFGFPHHATWDVIGSYDERASDLGEDALGHDDGVAILKPLAILVRDQLALDVGRREVPGLPAADKALGALHSGIRVPSNAGPKELLPVLCATLELNCWPRFRELWTGGATASDMHYRWDQFRQAWADSAGAIVFTRYDVEPAADAPEGAQVKMFVSRTDTTEHTWTRPLTFVREDGKWRLENGIL